MSVPATRVRTATLHHAQVLAARAPQPVRTLPDHGPAHLAAEPDGPMVPIVDTSAAPQGPSGANIAKSVIDKRALSPC